MIVVDGKYYIEKYHAEFSKLWTQFAKNGIEGDEERAALTIQRKFRSKRDGRNDQNRRNNY